MSEPPIKPRQVTEAELHEAIAAAEAGGTTFVPLVVTPPERVVLDAEQTKQLRAMFGPALDPTILEPASDPLAYYDESLAECGCGDNFCDAWGCGDVRALVDEIRRLQAEGARLRRDLDAAIDVMARHDLSLGDVLGPLAERGEP